MLKGLFFIVFIVNISTSTCAIEALYRAGQQVWKLYTIIDNRGLDILHNAEVTEPLSDNPIIQDMERQVDEIHERLNQLKKLMGPKKIRDAVKSWPLGALTIRDIDTVELFIQSIDEYYKKFNQYRNESYHCSDSADVRMKEIFQSIEGDIGIIRKFATNEEKSLSNEEDIVAAIAGYAVVRGAEMCELPQFISNILIQLFRMLIIAELKTSTMLAYENIYKYVENEENKGWQRINSLARGELEKQFAIYINMFSLHMAVIDAIYNRACDPSDGNWIRDKSFYELEKTFQATVFGFNWSNCKTQSCNNIMKQKPRRCHPLFYEESVVRSPEDSVTECAYLSRIAACVLESGPYRFHYVDSAELGFLGRNSSCPKDNGHVIETSITPDGTYTACVCNFHNTHNEVSLLMVESDVKSNRVITGLRFVRKKKVLYIQLREGKLNSNGYIDQYSQRWIPIPRIMNSSLIEPISRENKAFFLDDVTLGPNYVLTGIKFNKVTRGSVTGFAIEVFGKLFDYGTGELFLEGGIHRLQKGSNETSGKILSFKRVSSVFTTLPHTVTPSDTKYVSLERSTLKDDFGQSTLPFFDAVPITFEVPSALGGVGIFHKGVEGYAGLISLRVYGIKYEKYFHDFKLSRIVNDRVLFNSSIH